MAYHKYAAGARDVTSSLPHENKRVEKGDDMGKYSSIEIRSKRKIRTPHMTPYNHPRSNYTRRIHPHDSFMFFVG